MKKLNIFIKIAIPLTIIVGAYILSLGFRSIPVKEMIKKMDESNAAGILTGTEYINDHIGISFDTPEITETDWVATPYRQQFTRQPNLYQASKAEFLSCEKDRYWPYFIFRARLKAIPSSRLKNETTEEFADRMRLDYVRDTSSQYLSEYWDRFIISEPEQVFINGQEYYKFNSHDIEEMNYLTCYIIVNNGWGYRFFFYGWGEPIDNNFVKDIMYSINYSEPQAEFEIDWIGW